LDISRAGGTKEKRNKNRKRRKKRDRRTNEFNIFYVTSILPFSRKPSLFDEV
jgi:hypothetical protein